jgi:hypothetical protein
MGECVENETRRQKKRVGRRCGQSLRLELDLLTHLSATHRQPQERSFNNRIRINLRPGAIASALFREIFSVRLQSSTLMGAQSLRPIDEIRLHCLNDCCL